VTFEEAIDNLNIAIKARNLAIEELQKACPHEDVYYDAAECVYPICQFCGKEGKDVPHKDFVV
jgi:hypothetical protein